MFPRNSSSDSESDASASSDDSRRSFRVSVCLRRYFADVRARAFVLVRARRRVRWLHRRIRKAFGLRGAFCLRAAGHLLPRAEPLRVLRDGECVEVIPLHEAQAENRSRQDAIAQTEAAESPPAGTAIATRPYSVDITDCNGTIPNGDATNNDRCGSDRLRACSTDPATARPPAADDRAVDTGDTLRAGGDGAGELLGLKRRALALLDAHCAPADDGEPPRRRARRRVRRRTRRAASPFAPPRSPAGSPAGSPRSPAGSPRSPAASARSPAGSPSAPRRSPAPSSTPRDVARNEDACARKPRMVHSLDLENIP